MNHEGSKQSRVIFSPVLRQLPPKKSERGERASVDDGTGTRNDDTVKVKCEICSILVYS